MTNAIGGVKRYEYDENHRMTAWYDENGNRVVQNVYDEMGRVVEQTDANGGTAAMSYTDGCTTATDNLGHVTRYYYDHQMRTIKVEYPDGSQETTAYNGEGFIASETDVLGVTASYTYDRAGHMLTAARGDRTTSFTYNEAGQMTSLTDPLGRTTRMEYDGHGNLLAVTDAMGGVTRYEYDSLSRMTKRTDAAGHTTVYEYSGVLVTAITDGEGHT